jgi:hypothetical protein
MFVVEGSSDKGVCSVDWKSLKDTFGTLVKEHSLVDICVGPFRVVCAGGDFPLERRFDMCCVLPEQNGFRDAEELSS